MRLTRVLRTMSGNVAFMKNLEHYSQFQPMALSVQQYLDFGRTGNSTTSFVFLKKELLVRLANIMKEITLLPPQLLEMPSAKLVKRWYDESFEEFLIYEHAPNEQSHIDTLKSAGAAVIDLDNISHTTVDRFNELLSNVLKRHAHVVETMAEGLLELKDSHGVDIASEKHIQYFLDRFYINRISIRMLMNQHLLLFGSVLPESPRHVGCIDPACNVEAVVNDAFENARFLCERYYMVSPDMQLQMINSLSREMPITITAVPAHLYHIMFELFKNAMRATVEFHGVDADLPHMRVFVVLGREDLSLKICDRGGGCPRTVLDQLFNYMYSTAPPPARDGEQAPLAGYGYGLPLSRLYARYFQGDMFLVSMDGHGTDACVYLKAHPPEASEVLPIYSTSSKREMTRSRQANDWTSIPGQGQLR